MSFLVRLARMVGYGNPLKGGKDPFNGGVHVDERKDQHKGNGKGGRDLFNGGAHKGKPHKPHRPHPHLDHDSGNNDWCY